MGIVVNSWPWMVCVVRACLCISVCFVRVL